jgi:hypothetical protein
MYPDALKVTDGDRETSRSFVLLPMGSPSFNGSTFSFKCSLGSGTPVQSTPLAGGSTRNSGPRIVVRQLTVKGRASAPVGYERPVAARARAIA